MNRTDQGTVEPVLKQKNLCLGKYKAKGELEFNVKWKNTQGAGIKEKSKRRKTLVKQRKLIYEAATTEDKN